MPPSEPVQPVAQPDTQAVADTVKAKRKGAQAKYPFETMEVNATFKIPPGPDQPLWSSFRVYCCNRGKDFGKRFRCHKYPDGTYEVWRER